MDGNVMVTVGDTGPLMSRMEDMMAEGKKYAEQVKNGQLLKVNEELTYRVENAEALNTYMGLQNYLVKEIFTASGLLNAPDQHSLYLKKGWIVKMGKDKPDVAPVAADKPKPVQPQGLNIR